MTPAIRAIVNGVSALGYRVASLVTLLIVTPLIFVHLGSTRYGEWALLSTIPTYFALFDMGTTAFVRPSAQMIHAADFDRLSRTIASGTLLLGGLALAALVVLVGLATPLTTLLQVPRADVGPMILALVFLGTGAVVSFGLSPLAGLMAAAHRQNVVSRAAAVGVVIGATLSVGVIATGHGIAALGLVNGLGLCAAQLVLVAAVPRVVPEIRLRARRPEMRLVRPILKYALVLNAGSVAGALNLYLDRWIIAGIRGVTAVAFYDLGWRLAMAARGFLQAPYAALLALVTHYVVRGDGVKLATLVDRGTAAIVGSGMLALVVGTVFAPVIALAWLGQSASGEVAAVFTILLVGYVVNNSTVLLSQVTVADGRPGLLAISSLAIIVMHLVVSPLLTIVNGPIGTVIGASVTLVCGSALFAVLFERRYGLQLANVRRFCLVLAASTAAATCTGVAIRALFAPTGRTIAVIEVLVGGCLCTGVFCGMLLVLPGPRRAFAGFMRAPSSGLLRRLGEGEGSG